MIRTLPLSVRRLALWAGCLVTTAAIAQAPLRSGLPVGERPLPFTANVVTGPQRGTQHCYVCALKEEPAIVVFARTPDKPTARLIAGLHELVRQHAAIRLFGWVVFLGPADDAAEAALEHEVLRYAEAHAIAGLPIAVLGDPQGPPGYLIHPEAEITVLAFRRQQVLFNRAFRKGEVTRRTTEQLWRDAIAALTQPSAP